MAPHLTSSTGTDASRRIPAAFLDELLATLGCNFQQDISAFVDFDGRVDEHRLARAAALVLAAEPVLGCRFVEHPLRPHWTPCPAPSPDELCGVELCDEPEARTTELALEPLPEDRGARFRLHVLRGSTDRLHLKVDHRAADAGGLKELLGLLSTAYRALSSMPGFRLPRRDPVEGRSIRQVMDGFGVRDRAAMAAAALRERAAYSLPAGGWQIALGSGKPGFLVCHVEPGRGRRIRGFARTLGATVNDVSVAAFARALDRTAGAPAASPRRLLTTVDLRRYVPGRRGGAICNLAAFAYVTLPAELGPDLAATTALVKAQMDAKKRAFLGLGDVPHIRSLRRVVPFFAVRALLRGALAVESASGRGRVALTNLGPIAPERVDFGEPATTGAFLLPPLTYPPGFALGLSGFRDGLTFSAGSLVDGPGRSSVPMLLDALLDELP